MTNQTLELISQELRRSGSERKADWWNHYLKGEIPFLGVGIPEIRKVFLDRDRKSHFCDLALNKQVGMVNGLMKGDYAEEKLAAILYIQLFWLQQMKPLFLMNLVEDWFDHRLIYDWNTTDWLSVKVLTTLVDTGEDVVLWKLKKWSRDPYLWKARASLVPFARCSEITTHSQQIERTASMLIRRNERFAKTAVGWVLREYSRYDPDFVLTFLSRHVKYTSAEVKRNALKYYRERLKEI